jgi:hypothetical protein
VKRSGGNVVPLELDPDELETGLFIFRLMAIDVNESSTLLGLPAGTEKATTEIVMGPFGNVVVSRDKR